MTSKKIILSVLLLSFLTAATAGYRWWKAQAPAPERELPSAVEELKKVMQQYRRIADTSASVAATIRIYDLENKAALKETRTFRYVRCGAGYYAQLSYLQTFCDGKWIVQLDTVNRQIGVTKLARDAAGTNLSGASGTIAPGGAAWIGGGSLEALFSDTARFRTTGTVTAEGDQRALHMHSDLNPEIRSVALYYDTLAYHLYRTEIEYWKPTARLDDKSDKVWLAKIEYHYPQAEKMDIRRMFTAIVTIDGRKVTVGAAYRDYQLNLNNNGF